MHASAAFLLAVASFAAAQSSTSSTSTAESGCGESIDLIIRSCLTTTGAQLEACAANDWGCLCEQSNNVLTCYNNCPSDPNRFGVEQTNVANCNAASAYPSSSSTARSSATGSAGSVSSPTGTTNNAASTSSAAPSATNSAGFDSGAGHAAVPAGLAAVLGLAALF